MERLKVLVTVKTYPIPSAKYDELSCTAGVTEAGDFIRLYPDQLPRSAVGPAVQKVPVDRSHGREAHRPRLPKGELEAGFRLREAAR